MTLNVTLHVDLSELKAYLAEVRRLRRELERVQMERDILKKAIGIFSGAPR